MAHFAKVVNGIVTNVIVAEPEFFETFVDTSPGEWIQTSYNTKGGVYYKPNSNTPHEDQSKALRKNYASVGYAYDKERDAFIPPKPFSSWVLNEQTCQWDAPTPMPATQGNKKFSWDENNKSWVEITY